MCTHVGSLVNLETLGSLGMGAWVTSENTLISHVQPCQIWSLGYSSDHMSVIMESCQKII